MISVTNHEDTKKRMEDLPMGFFSDLKDDLSQAVNELMPEEGAEEAEAKKKSTFSFLIIFFN